MGSLAIVSPVQATVVDQSNPTMGRLLSPDPKESAIINTETAGVVLSFSGPVMLDSLYLGYHSADGPQTYTLTARNPDGSIISTAASGNLAQPGSIIPLHTYQRFSPVSAQRFHLDFSKNGGGNFSVGVAALGLAFQPEWGIEWGAGRIVEDTGSADRLFGGGFGIDRGVSAGGYQWTFGDLQPAEVRSLYQLVRRLRTTESFLVVEDTTPGDDMSERLHWCLFDRLETYERLDPQNTKWSFRVRDWA